MVDARDEEGKDVGDATLTIDGEVITHQLDGKAIPVDPGAHTLTLQRNAPLRSTATTPKVTETIIAKEGAKARAIKFVLPALRADSAADTRAGGHTLWPWLVVGAGVVTVGVGLAYILTTPSLPAQCNLESAKCTQVPGQSRADFEDVQVRAGQAKDQPTLGGIIAGVGGVAVAAGLLWHVLEPTKPRTARVGPWLLPGGGGLSARAAF